MSELEKQAVVVATGAARRFWNALAALFERHPARVALFVVLLAGAALTGQMSVTRTAQHQDIVSQTVLAEGEDTPQRFKMLEAFIMSTLPATLTEVLEDAELSPKLTAWLKHLDVQLRAAPDAQAGANGERSHSEESGKLSVRLSIPDYKTASESLTPQTGILTDNAEHGYLFLPLSLLRQRIDSPQFHSVREESKQHAVSPALAEIVAREHEIVDDIEVSKVFLPFMDAVGVMKLFEPNPSLDALGLSLRPIQTYYITKNGVARFVERRNASNEQLIQRNVYRSATYFPSRPYFVAAMQRIKPYGLADVSGKAKPHFYVSRPYMDLGGVGVVVTLALPLSYPGHSDAVLCFDLAVMVEDYVNEKLERTLDSFGAASTELDCRIGFEGNNHCTTLRGDRNHALALELEERLNDVMRSGSGLSNMIGDVTILQSKVVPTPTAMAGFSSIIDYIAARVFQREPRGLTFAIPLGAPSAHDHAIGVHFFVSSLNLERFQQVTILLALVSVAMVAAAIFLITFSWQGESRKRRAFEDALKAMDRVQYTASTPYCRLDSDDSIVDCNLAMCMLLEMPEEEASVKALKERTFESLLARRSKAAYRDVRERRLKGASVASYDLTLISERTGDEIETIVTSGALPQRSSWESPQTFGIIVPRTRVSGTRQAAESVLARSNAAGNREP